jgi:hypothetical protein
MNVASDLPRRVFVACLVSLSLAGAVGVSSAIADNNDLGRLIVKQPCCSGQALQGVRSTISAANTATFVGAAQILFSVGAEDTVTQIAQIGVQVDNGLEIDLDPSCYPSLTFTYFYEWWDYANDIAHCKNLGNAVPSNPHLYSTAEQSGGKWQLFMDGNPELSQPLIQMMGTGAPAAHLVEAGGEIVYCDTCSPSSDSWTSTFAGSGNTAWQRYNFNSGWYTIQSNNAICNGPPNTCTGGGWSFGTTMFPTVWSVSH